MVGVHYGLLDGTLTAASTLMQSLYDISPSLQGLALTAMPMRSASAALRLLDRILPVVPAPESSSELWSEAGFPESDDLKGAVILIDTYSRCRFIMPVDDETEWDSAMGDAEQIWNDRTTGILMSACRALDSETRTRRKQDDAIEDELGS